MRVLSRAVNLHQSGKILSASGISIHSSHHGCAAFEYANAVAQDLQDDAVLFLLAEDFDIEGLCSRIKVCTRFLNIPRCNPLAQRRQGLRRCVV